MKIFNTLGKKTEQFLPARKSEVSLYSCGPTVYAPAHIGNLRAYIFADTVKRALDFNGLNVSWTMNITDVDDKTIANTIKQFGPKSGPQELLRFTDQYSQIFFSDLAKINVEAQDINFVKVTEKIADIQLFILELLKKGFAYRADDGSTYFSIEKYQEKFGDYGALVGEKFLAGKKIGARVNVDEYDKENLSDFALWKAHGADDGEIFWDHPELGPGRPGWHIECTLINYFRFPHGTDIHTGGIDLIFPHHTNEIAQAQPIYRPFVRHWMHNEHIIVDGKKMSKSLGNFYTLGDLEKEDISGLDLRYLYLQSHYRSKLNVTKESLKAAQNGLASIRKQLGGLVAAEAATKATTKNGEMSADLKFISRFESALNEDLNTPEALAVLSELLNSDLSPAKKLATAFKMDEALGLNLENTLIISEKLKISELPAEIQKLLNARDQAKKSKNYAEADKIRGAIEAKGFELTDTADGTAITRKS